MLSILVKRVTLGLLSLILAMLLIWQLSIPAFAQTKPQSALAGKSVLALHAFEANMPIFEMTDRGLRAALRSGGIEIGNQFYEYLDLRRNPGSEHRKLMADLMRLRYGHRKMDMAIALYPEALQFLLNEGRSISPDAPILALYIPPGFELPKTDRRIICQIAQQDMIGTLEIALKLVPGAKRVYVVGGANEVDRKYLDEARGTFKKWEGQLKFRYLSEVPLQEILDTVSTAPPGTIVLLMGFSSDVTGKNYTTPEVGERLSQVSKVPVFGLLQVLLGHGIAGGKLLSFEYIGTNAGELALDILRGSRAPENIPPVWTVPAVPMFDWQQLQRWNLDENSLPKGSIVINKELTLWDLRYYIIGALIFCLLETALIIFLVVQRHRKKVAEDELNQFFNVSLDLKCIANTDGYFLRLNPAWERTLGYTLEELMTKRFLEFVHPDDLGRTQEAVSTLASQQKVISFENRYRCKDGTYRWLEWSSAPAGKLIYAAARDVTERKQAEEVLKERLKFETLLTELSVHFVNLPADRIDSEIEDGQRRICELFDLDRSTLFQVPEGEPGALLLTHFHQPPGSLPPPERMNARVFVPWVTQKVLAGETVTFSKLTDLPAEAGRDRETARAYGTKSGVFVPLSVGEEPVFGVLTFVAMREERSWPETVVTGFKLIAQVFANALARTRAEQALRESETRLQGLAGRLIYAQEEERSRLARELHDDLAQRLAVFAIDVGKLEQQLVDRPAPVLEELREMTKNIVKISEDVHSLSRQLHPSILDDLGLIKAAEAECMNFSRREGIDIVFNHENIPMVIPKDISLSLYRIIQEGLTNISKHACAEHISISLKGVDHDVLLSVQDDGIGFDSAEAKDKPGLGFSSMRERARLIHGEFSIKSQPEKGTLITVRAPLTREGE